MVKTLFLTLALIPTAAFAHVEPGTYTGITADKSVCSMVAGAQYFVDDKPHPLNERIRITVDGTEFVVGHPAVIDTSKDLVSFNHDLFQGVRATNTGAQVLEIVMSHEPGKEGPVSFALVENFWKTGKKTALRCGEFTYSR